MTSKTTKPRTAKPAPQTTAKPAPQTTAKPARTTRTEVLIGLMRAETGATAQALAEAVGWQVHSIRGFIAGTLKKRPDLVVSTSRVDGATRYRVSGAEAPTP